MRRPFNDQFAQAPIVAEIPAVNIMGVDIAAINMPWLLDFTERHLEELRGDYICVTNVYATVSAYRSPAYKEVQNGGVMSIPDGGPLSSVGRKRGFSQMSRTTGPDYMEEVLRLSQKHGWRHYFYGSTEETLAKMQERLGRQYPSIQIAGVWSPPFRELSTEEELAEIRRVNDSRPDFIWVALGAPKQEIWMAEHQGLLNGLMVGVGAAFDYLAGNIERAPQWAQNNNLEWLWRFMQDPRHTGKKYATTNASFIYHAVMKGE